MTSWLAWLPSQPLLRMASLAALVLALLTVLVMLYVLAVSHYAHACRRRYKGFVARWRPVLAQAGVGVLEHVPAPPAREEEVWFLLLWTGMQRSLRGAARQRLNDLLVSLGLVARTVEWLHGPARGVRRRLVALTALRYLADPGHWPDIEPLVRHPNRFLSLAAAESLIAIDPGRAMDLLLPIAATRMDWSMRRVEGLCRQAGADAVTPALLRLLDAPPPATDRGLVPLLTCASPARIAPWARHALASCGNAHERRASLRVLGELRDPADRAYFVTAAIDPDPDVRLAAVQALRRQAGREDKTMLLALLADSSWWVRQEAADALVALPGIDASERAALESQVSDRYGRDALRRALAEAGA